MIQNDNKNKVNVHTGAIHIENKVKLLARQAWFYMVQKSSPYLKTKDIFTLSLMELKQAIGYNSRNNKYLKEVLKELVETTVEWNIFEKDKEKWEVNSLLACCHIEEGSGICEFGFSPFLRRKLVNPETYIKIDLLISGKFKSKYTLAIYCLMFDYLNISENRGEKNLSIEELRKYLGLTENKYPRVVNLNQEILKKAEQEININSDMHIEITPVRVTNRKITGFTFKISIKDEYLDKYKPDNLLLEASGNNLISDKKVPYNTEKGNQIDIENEVLQKFFANNSISIYTVTVQEKLRHISENFDKDTLESYLLFLKDYSLKEKEKGNVKKLSGFYINLLKDDNQLQNYRFYIEEKEKKESELKSKFNQLFETKVKSKYNSQITDDFKLFMENNFDKVEPLFTEIVKEISGSNPFIEEFIIGRKNKGNIDKNLIKNPAIMGNLFSRHTEFNFQPVSFESWKELFLSAPENKEDIEKIKQSCMDEIKR